MRVLLQERIVTLNAYETCIPAGTNPSFFFKVEIRKFLPASLKKYLAVFLIAIFPLLSNAQNPISNENGNTGNLPTEWEISGAGNLTIQGFATKISINTGEQVDFKIDVKAPATNYSIKIYRLGYYNGRGARLISDLGNTFVGLAQPTPLYETSTGKTDCSNWSVSASWTATGAVSGIYIAKLTRVDNGGSSHIAFVVRNDGANSAILFKTADATWQAYNNYGGNSLYVNNSGTPVPGFNHATKVSYNRPFYTRAGGGGGGAAEDWLFNAEYPMLRWLERNGYDVSYTTDLDMDRDPKPITPNGDGITAYGHKIILSVGHDEYWSAAQRTKFENARNAGVHLAFFSGNEVYWKTRWEDNHQTLVCYKEGTLGENVCGNKCDLTSPIWTGLWRDGNSLTYPGSDGGKPENALTGQISWDPTTTSIVVPDTYKNHRFWRNTSVASLGAGQSVTLPFGTLGYEWDWEQPAYAANNPNGRITLSNTNFNGHTHKMSLYKVSPNGALVFGAGTVQWSWGLDNVHDRGNEAPSLVMQQATVNLFADMGVQAYDLHAGLVAATASTDNTAPVSIITSPLEAASLPAGVTVNITGTATDVGGIVAGVEVSVDGGTTWNVATGTNSWTYAWTPAGTGPATILSRAFDDIGNIETAGTAPAANAKNVTITPAPPAVCPCTIFQPTDAPTAIKTDGQPITLGVKFRSTINGYITGIRFYKGVGNTGTHIGQLWSSTGALLASATFTGETASGWQQVNFGAPVAITAGTTYVAAYQSLQGFYSATENFFTTTITNGPLQGLQNVQNDPNGVYAYSPNPTFPTATYQSSNYWVDPVFNTVVAPDETPPTVVSVSPVSGSTGVNISTTIVGTFNEAIDPSSVTSTSVFLNNGASLVPATVVYNAGLQSAVLTPASTLSYSTTYTATIKGGTGYDRIRDIAGNALAADYTWTFTTSGPPPPPPVEGLGGPILVISSASNPFSRYAIEILRAEGINSFDAKDISQVSQADLDNHDVIILGEISLSPAQVTQLTTWVTAGGTLVAFKPDAQLYGLMGISASTGTLADKYLLVNTASGPGTGIVNQTIQFHGSANLHTLNGATALATLYSNATTATVNPAVTSINVGSNGGKAIAFTYDLARSVVYTRQGNPDWAGQRRDAQAGPIRSDNLFFPDYIDFNKIQIPQADEQQHLLSNIITQGSLHRKPLPKFWFLPRKLKAAIVMTGDDHANGGTVARFARYKALSGTANTPEDVRDWRAIRSSSYIYTSTELTTISAVQAQAFEADGFEVAAHITTNCGDWTSQSQLDNSFFTPQLLDFASKWPGVPSPTTNRTHCIAWSDWASQAKVQASKGIRLDANYYYWPESWILNRPGMFTGSGMPMRFADLDGSLIDCYQVTTQMPDESGIQWPGFINTLLNNAIGTNGYYGVFCANMHTDNNNVGDQSVVGSEAIVKSAIDRQVPVISARQMLQWLDGRNGSNFNSMVWSGNTLSFTITNATQGEKLQAMVPVSSASGTLTGVTRNSAPVTYTTEIIKGINYAFFDATAGNYVANYNADILAPVISNVVVTPNANGSAVITWTTNEPSDSRVDYGTSATTLTSNGSSASLVTSHSITVSGLIAGTTYYFRVRSNDASSNSTTEPITGSAALSFAMPAGVCATDDLVADFSAGTTGANTIVTTSGNGAVTLKPLINEEFSVLGTPSGWTDAPWGTGGTTTYSGGQTTVNGSHLSNNTQVGPGTSLEFTATFTLGDFQNIGFTADADFNNPWVVIGRGNIGSSDLNVYARTSSNQTVSLGALTGAPHLYRIQWKAGTNNFEFYVDGILIATPAIAITVATPLIIQISDFPVGGVGLSVDWIRASLYPALGTFTSRIFNAGTIKSWQQVNWTEDVPTNTTLLISQRQSNSSAEIINASWIPVLKGAFVGGISQFIQYKADFATTNPAVTPELRDISFTCEEPSGNTAPIVTAQPAAQTKCVGESVSFTSAASGVPAPTVQWQLSTDGGTIWTDISGATSPTYTFTAGSTDNGKQYRAVWTNSEGFINSNPATLTVNPLPTATLAAVKNPVCEDETISLQLTGATGQSPYSVIVNGVTYPNVTAGTPFVNFSKAERSIWGSTGNPASESVTDNQPIEVGTKFRSSVSGYITGIRFYKGLTNTGAHTANLWSSTGTQLASAIFTAETASGWQEVKFASPVAIQANTTYVASYFSAGGYFAISPGFFTSPVINAPLTALQAGTDGVNGVFKYGGGFPDGGNNANYWVDVLFKQTLDNSPQIYNLTTITDANNCTNTGAPLLSTVTVTTSITGGTISASPSTVCAGEPINLTFTTPGVSGPYSLVINGTTYTDIYNGVPFAAGNATVVPSTIWSPATIGGSQTADRNPTELGLRFRSSVAGTISGIRFYQNSIGTSFTGSIWAVGNTTAPLATATYPSVGSVGWKQIDFSTPVPITANTDYIASYFSPNLNYYAYTLNGLPPIVVNPPLTALSSSYNQPGTGYPGTTSTANYWVDVVFNGPSGITNYNLTSITNAAGCSATGSPISTAAVTVNNIPTAAITNITGSTVLNAINTSISLTATGGGTYSWWNGVTVVGTSANLTVTSPATYTVTVTGTNGCTSTASINITSGTVSLTCATDNTAAQFGLGNPGTNTIVVEESNGAIILKPYLNQEFSSSTTPVGWEATGYNPLATGVGFSFSGGAAIVDHASVSTFPVPRFGPGTSIEFRANFANGNSSQNIGFSSSPGFVTSWVVIGRNSASPVGGVFARTSPDFGNVNIQLGSSLTQGYHQYKINWNANSIDFYVDGVISTTINSIITGSFGLEISDFDDLSSGDGIPLSVDWIRVSPFASTGVFTSRVMDAGSTRNWDKVSWDAIVEPGTSIVMEVRTGASPDLSGTTFAPFSNGATLNMSSQYIQYQATLASSNPLNTPVLEDVSFSCFAAFPVELVSLRGSAIGRDVKLEWRTASESNNRGFEVQRSLDGNNWQDAGFVPGAGNSSTFRNYSFLDKNLPGNKYFYRLKQIDFDGRFTLSNIISISLNTNNGYILDQNYPNPFNNSTMIGYSLPKASYVQIRIYDLQGRVVQVVEDGMRPAGKHTIQVKTDNLSHGVYYYKMKAGDFTETKRMIMR